MSDVTTAPSERADAETADADDEESGPDTPPSATSSALRRIRDSLFADAMRTCGGRLTYVICLLAIAVYYFFHLLATGTLTSQTLETLVLDEIEGKL